MGKGKNKKKLEAKPEVLTWREQLSAINPLAVKGCNVELSMLVEYFPKYINSTQALQFFTYPRVTLKLQCVIYEEILYLIKHYPAWERSYLDADVEANLREAVDEAKPFLKAKTPIPLELMAQLVKLRVIALAQEHIRAAPDQTPPSSVGSSSSTSTEEDSVNSVIIEDIFEEETTPAPTPEYNDEDVFGIVPQIDDVFYAGGSSPLRGYISALKTKREVFLKRTGDEKPDEEVLRIDDCASKKCKPPWSIKHLKWKKGGTSTSKSSELEGEGRSLHVILTGFYDAALVAELRTVGLPLVCVIALAQNEETPSEPIYSLENMESRHAPIYNWTLHGANQRLKNFACTTYYKALVLWHCYEALEVLFDSDPSLNDVVYFRCEPGEEIYGRVCEVVQEIPQHRATHSEYLKRIRLRHLGATPEVIPASKMAFYNASLNKVPPECCSISLLLDSLLEEVEQEEKERVFGRYKFKRAMDLKVDLSRFVVHEKNALEMSLRCYPQVKGRLHGVNLAYLGMSKPALLWRKHPRPKRKSDLEENQYFHWASSLRLSPEELNTCLQLYTCKFLSCPREVPASLDLKWQEDLSPKTMLQEVEKASAKFRCMDHIYSPLLDAIFLRFHDASDDFGVSTSTWSEMIHAPVGLHDFFKWVGHHRDAPTLFGYDFRRWQGIQGVSTLFRSCDGFSVRVDKERRFQTAPRLSIHFETNGHGFHLDTPTGNDGFAFNFLLANGCRVSFAKPARYSQAKNCEGHRRGRPKLEKPKPVCYLVERTSDVCFKERRGLQTRASLKNILRRSSTISALDSLGSIELKPKRSTVALLKTPIRARGLRRKVLKALKKSVRPRFKICSSILHRYNYVKVERERITINFANLTTTKRFTPRARLKHRVKITPCFHLPPQGREGRPSGAIYDVRLSLPTGLHVLTEEGPNHIVQYYASEKGPTCKGIEDEVSRTYLRSGFVCVRYADGSLKMLGVNGVGAKCKAPFVEGLRQKTHRKKPLIDKYQDKFVGGRRSKRVWKDRCDPNLVDLCAKIRSAELVTDDGRKFSVGGGGRVGLGIEFEVFGAGAHSSTNQDGELSTVYPDGTRVTSWYRVEQEMVLVPGDPLSGELELDEDDYLCNFLIPRRGGWISVQLYYQFEHPNYATVIYGGGDKNFVQLRLPGGAELRAQVSGYSLSVKDQIFADVSAADIILRSNFCRRCYDSCVTRLNIKHLYENSGRAPDAECLLVASDNFGKVFRVTRDGKCHRNEDHKSGGKVKRDCLTHRRDVSEKYYAWNRDLSGKLFWNQDMYLNRMMAAQYGKMQRVRYYLDEAGGLAAYEFLKYVPRPYCQKFLMEYGPPDPPIFKLPKSRTENPFETVAFTKRRFIKALPDCEKSPAPCEDARDFRVSFEFEDFIKWVKKIEDRVVFDDRNPMGIARYFPSERPSETSPLAPTNSPLSLPERVSETAQINLFASAAPTALLVQDDYLPEALAFSKSTAHSEILRPKFKEKSTCTATRFDLFQDDWGMVPSKTSPAPQKTKPREKEFVCKSPTRIEPPKAKPKSKATSTSSLGARCKCRRSLHDLIRENPQATGEFVRKPKPNPAALQRTYAKHLYQEVVERNQKFYKHLECKLTCNKGKPQKKTSPRLRRDSGESVFSEELQSTLPLVLPGAISEDSFVTLLAPRSAAVTRCERKYARPFRPPAREITAEPLPKEEDNSEEKLPEEIYRQVGNLTPQSFDVFLRALRQRFRKIEEVDNSEIVRKVSERFDLLLEEDEVSFPRRILMLQHSLRLLGMKRKEGDSPKSSVADVII